MSREQKLNVSKTKVGRYYNIISYYTVDSWYRRTVDFNNHRPIIIPQDFYYTYLPTEDKLQAVNSFVLFLTFKTRPLRNIFFCIKYLRIQYYKYT